MRLEEIKPEEIKLTSIVWLVNHQMFWIVTVVSLVMWAFLSWQAWQRPNKKYLVGRLLASAGLVLALAMLGLQPARQTTQKTLSAILLTNEYTTATVDSLREREDSVLVFGYQEVAIDKHTIKAPDAAFIQRNYPQLGTLHIVGDGVQTYDLPRLKSFNAVFHLNPIPAGFTSVNYAPETIAQDRWQVKGSYHNPTDTNVVLVLASPGGAVDSALIGSRQTENFALRDRPKEAGQFIYRVLVKAPTGDTLYNEPVPVHIRPKQKLNIVIINSFPRFETKYLKNWLATEGHQVAVRSVISKNKVKDEFVNQSATGFQLNAALLKQIDLLILDAEYAQGLGAGTMAVLRQAIKNQGLGVLIQADESGRVPTALASFPLGRIEHEKTMVDGNDFGVKGSFELKQQPYLLQQKLGMLALVRNQQGQALVGYNVTGLGSVGISLIAESYQLLLDGKPSYYAAYWSHLLSKLAKKQIPTHVWEINTAFPKVNASCKLTLSTATPQPVGTLTKTSNVLEFYLQNQVNFDQKWNGTVWAEHQGWHQLRVKGDTTEQTPLYIFGEQDWQNWQTIHQIRANDHWARQQATNANSNTVTPLTQHQPIPLAYFFGLFLLCTGFLWLEPKL
ncbi:hypothetical protein [uncultured Microscilla sp.]|uniref:hypothetical protein n=1 Tax=uncultured Microscilla sp. TaxID=432653 RepID=UPI00261F1F17|nr:hypothetical protein [uncultured Microscilla sp.]